MINLTAALFYISGSQAPGLENFARNLQEARVRDGSSYQLYLRDATLLASKELSGQNWTSTKRIFLKQGIGVDEEENWGRLSARLTVPETDFVSASKPIHKLEIIVWAEPRTSPNAASKMTITYPSVDLLSEPSQDFKTFSAEHHYAQDTILGRALARPALVAATKSYPILDRIRLEYQSIPFPRSAYPRPTSLPYVFMAHISLAKGPKWHRSGIEFEYFARSGLDAEADFQGHSVDPTFVGKDSVGDIEIPFGRTEADFLKAHSANSIDQFVIERISTDSQLPDRGAKAYSRGDLATLQTSTTAIRLTGDSLKGQDFELLARFPKLERLDFGELNPFTEISSNDFVILKRLKNLRELVMPIAGGSLSRSDVRAIASLPKLESLDINNLTLTSQEFGLLFGIKTLKKLTARNCKGISDTAFLSLAKNHNIHSLNLLGTEGYSGKSLARLAGKNLREISLDHLSLSAQSALPEFIRKCSLTEISLRNCSVSAELLSTISDTRGLKVLTFWSCIGLDDRKIQQLHALTQPDWVEFLQCPGPSGEGVKNLMNQYDGKYHIIG